MIFNNYEADLDPRIRRHIDDEVERLVPHLKRILPLFWYMSWQTDDRHAPEITTQIMLKVYRHPEPHDPPNEVFFITLYSTDSDTVSMSIDQHISDNNYETLAHCEQSFLDWGVRLGENNI
jgi:hypothetical protein